MKNPRKGSRPITVDGVEYAWYRGKSVTEVRNLETNKAIHIPNTELETMVNSGCGCGCGHGEYAIVLPGAIRSHLQKVAI